MRCRLFGRNSRLRHYVAASVVGVLSYTTVVQAADVAFEGDVSSNWSVTGNWVGNTLPTTGDNAVVADALTATINSNVGTVDNVFISGGGKVSLLTGSDLTADLDVSVGHELDSPGSLSQAGGDLAVGRFLVIGDFADGDFTMTGGTTTIGAADVGASLVMGFEVAGSLTMSGGELTQAAVDLASPDSLNFIGIGPGGTATIDLSGGVISMSASTYLGGDGGATGVVNQTGGTFEVRDRSVRIGGFTDEENPTSGTYNISGGTLSTGTGLSIGYGAFSTGVVNISDEADVQVGGQIFMGLSDDVNPGHGEINQTGGTVVTGVQDATLGGGDSLLVGYGDESSAAYNLSGGALSVPGFGILGIFGCTESEMTIDGADTVFQVGGPNSALQVGGQTSEDPADPTYGKPTAGHLTQNDGTVVVNGNLQIASGPYATGVYEMNGGVLDVSGVAFFTVNPPETPIPGDTVADASFIQTGGEATLHEIALVGYDGKGTISVSGGTLKSDLLPGPDAESFVVGATFDRSTDSSMNISGGQIISAGRVRIADGVAENVQLNVSGTGKLLIGTELDTAELYVGGGLDPDNPDPNSGIANQSGGEVDVTGFTFIGLGTLEEAPDARAFGTYNMSGGTLNLHDTAAVGLGGTGVFSQTGGTVNAFNAIVVANDATAEGSYELAGGVLDLQGTAIFPGDGAASFTFTGGTLTDAREIDFSFEQTGGLLSTGEVPNFTVIAGDYSISGDAALEVKLGGLTQADEYDIYQVDGATSLGGTLMVSLVGDFAPQIGDLFEILVSGSDITGTFDGLNFASNPGNLSGQLIYETNRVILEIVQGNAGVPGDTDDDGDVDLTDLNNVRNNFGSAAAPIGDTDDDGDVDLDDLNAVRNNFGFVSPSPTADTSSVGGGQYSYDFQRPDFSGVSRLALGDGFQAQKYTDLGLERTVGPQAVPEPSTWALGLITSLGGLIAWRRRK